MALNAFGNYLARHNPLNSQPSDIEIFARSFKTKIERVIEEGLQDIAIKDYLEFLEQNRERFNDRMDTLEAILLALFHEAGKTGSMDKIEKVILLKNLTKDNFQQWGIKTFSKGFERWLIEETEEGRNFGLENDLAVIGVPTRARHALLKLNIVTTTQLVEFIKSKGVKYWCVDIPGIGSEQSKQIIEILQQKGLIES